MIHYLPFNYKLLRYFLYMGIVWTSIGVLVFSIGFKAKSFEFLWLPLGILHLILWIVYKKSTYLIIDHKSITQNKIIYKKQLFFNEIEHVDEYAGDYIFFGKNKKITLRKNSFLLDDYDIIKEVAKKIKSAS